MRNVQNGLSGSNSMSFYGAKFTELSAAIVTAEFPGYTKGI